MGADLPQRALAPWMVRLHLSSARNYDQAIEKAGGAELAPDRAFVYVNLGENALHIGHYDMGRMPFAACRNITCRIHSYSSSTICFLEATPGMQQAVDAAQGKPDAMDGWRTGRRLPGLCRTAYTRRFCRARGRSGAKQGGSRTSWRELPRGRFTRGLRRNALEQSRTQPARPKIANRIWSGRCFRADW